MKYAAYLGAHDQLWNLWEHYVQYEYKTFAVIIYRQIQSQFLKEANNSTKNSTTQGSCLRNFSDKNRIWKELRPSSEKLSASS